MLHNWQQITSKRVGFNLLKKKKHQHVSGIWTIIANEFIFWTI